MTARRRAHIFDMDGTLADVSPFRHHVAQRPKDFAAFHAASVNARPHEDVVQAARDSTARGIDVFVVTARRLAWRYHTIIWLHEQQVPYVDLVMRADDDYRRDVEVKADILARLRCTHDVEHAWDDNPAVIDLWLREGIPTTVVPGWATG